MKEALIEKARVHEELRTMKATRPWTPEKEKRNINRHVNPLFFLGKSMWTQFCWRCLFVCLKEIHNITTWPFFRNTLNKSLELVKTWPGTIYWNLVLSGKGSRDYLHKSCKLKLRSFLLFPGSCLVFQSCHTSNYQGNERWKWTVYSFVSSTKWTGLFDVFHFPSLWLDVMVFVSWLKSHVFQACQ